MAPHNPTFWDACIVIILHPLGKAIAALLIWCLSFAYAIGSFKAEVKAMRHDIQQLEEKVNSIDEYLRGPQPYSTP